MPLKINRNYFTSKIFFEQLSHLDIKDAVISPGSRNTPLVLALADNNKITKHVIVDERSAAFFALGIAKKTLTPVILVCTSGTAAVEYYPAIVEAFYSNTSLIICTADRPNYLQNTGANQTINQKELYRNHILSTIYINFSALSVENTLKVKQAALNAYSVSNEDRFGPVHINFPFEKPFEPDNYTDEIDDAVVNESKTFYNFIKLNYLKDKRLITNTLKQIKKHAKGLITVGPLNEHDNNYELIIKVSERIGYPIFADSTSNLRFFKSRNNFVISNPDAILRSDELQKEIMPEMIIHFGSFNTSVYYEHFLKEFKGKRFVVNKNNNKVDPVNFNSIYFNATVKEFCELLLNEIPERKVSSTIIKIDETIEEIKNEFINKLPFNSPLKLANKIVSLIPENSNLFLSNSLPVRDFDFFASKSNKKINVYSNRGASGIDGIISTSLGVALNGNKTILVMGDLAFYYDINAIHVAIQNKIPTTIILINNNGGGIFNFLPVSQNKNFEKFFQTPLNINFSKIVKAFGGKYFLPKNENELAMYFYDSLNSNTFTVIEIKTNEKTALEERKLFWNEIKTKYFINENVKR